MIICVSNEFQKMAPAAETQPKSIHEFIVKDTFGNAVPLDKYKGKVCLVVNTATKCPLTNMNFENLTNLKKQYEGKGTLLQKYIYIFFLVCLEII